MSFAMTTIVRDGRRSDRPTCVLLTNYGIYWSLADYFLCRNLSLSTERGYARSIARLMNWTEAKHPNFQAGGPQDSAMFSSFLHDLLYGTVRNGEDASGLWWSAHSPDVVSRTAGHIAEFSEWLATSGQGIAINPKDRPASAFERMIALKAFTYRKNASLLAHVKDSSAANLFAATARQVNPPGRTDKLLLAPPAFPEHKIEELLWVGFENKKFKNDPRPWKRWNLRDILITLICLYGGARVSEPMHLWIQDTTESDRDPQSCRVFIHEPDHGKITADDPIMGRRTMTRSDYLNQLCDGKVPLTRATGNSRSGWKGGLLNAPEKRAMEMMWIDADAGRLFKSIWQLYIQHVRPFSHNMPWAFLTKNGLPMGPSAYMDSLQRAVKKIGLSFKKSEGSTPHGLRHRYGQWLNDRGVNQKVGQVCMHHANPLSQEVYRQVTAEQVAHEMETAPIRINMPRIPSEVLCLA